MAPGAWRVLCLRPERDFLALGVAPPSDLDITYLDDERGLTAIAPDVAGLVLPSAGTHLDASRFDDAKGLRIIQYTGAGFDRIPDAALEGLGCAVCNVPGASAPDVAAYVVLASGVLLRKLLVGDEMVKAGRYAAARAELAPAAVRGFRGLKVGVVGFGGIGVAVASAFAALGATVRWFDPAPVARPELEQFPRSGLDELLDWSEVITVHVPLAEATRHLIGRAELARLGDGVLVNAARGGVVDEAALIEALDAGSLRGVALDVYGEEPLPADAPIVAAANRHSPRVLLSPHIAGVTPEASRELFVRAWENVRAVVVDGQEPAHRVR